MIKIISFKICPFVQRVTALLEAKEIPYEVEFISLADKPQWFIDISPNAQVPVLITESGIPLFESDAIVEYIDEITQPLDTGLSPEQRALDRAWSQQATKNYLVQCGAMRSADESTLVERAHKLGTAFAKIEKVLGDGPFFHGDSVSNVDVAWLTLLHRADIINRHTCYDFLADHPKVKAWQAELMNSGLAERSVAEDFEKAFTDFYLSDKTFLGGGEDCDRTLDAKCNSGTCC